MAPTQLSLRWNLVTVLLCIIAGSSWLASAAEVSQSCTAQWVLLTTYRNGLEQSVVHEFSYREGLLSSGGRWRPAWEKPIKELISIATKLQPRMSHVSSSGVSNANGPQKHSGRASSTEVYLSHDQLTRATPVTSKVTVPARGTVTFWQLVATSDGTRAGFGNIAVTSGSEEPPTVTSCSARYRVRALVGNSWFRLRRKSCGRYMTMTIRKGWNAATLGYSRQFRFRLYWSSVEDYGYGHRIEAETYSFGSYKYLYSSIGGGIYFDEYDYSGPKQLWTLSIREPRDGDAVTFRNFNWPTAYMTYYQGSETNIFCEYTHYPDQWIIELAP